MFKTLANAWKIADLRKKLLFTILIILLYRLGSAIPVPFTMPLDLGMRGTTLDLLNTLSGGAFEQATLFALGVSPYITASIVIQLLTVAIPALERLAKQGEEGKKKITVITRYITIGIAVVSAIGYYFMLKYGNGTGTSSIGAFVETESASWNTFFNVFQAVVIIACFCAGSAVVMWLAERINEHGIGNGISIILLANIVSRAYPILMNFIKMFKAETVGGSALHGVGHDVTSTGTLQLLPDPTLQGNAFPWGSTIFTVLVLVGLLAMMWFIIFISDSERRIPVQYAKRVVGRKMYGGQNSNIPLKLNMAGVMPIIFANAILTIPSMVANFIPYVESDGVTVRRVWYHVVNLFSSSSWFYCILMFVFILAFAYFYVAISFNPTEVAGNLQKQGGAIPGIRPGKATSTFIQKVLSKITFIGALALSVISVIPLIISAIINVVRRADGVADAIAVPLWSFAHVAELATVGSSVIIVVGVVLEVVRDMEAQMTMRHYKGFLG